MAESTPAAVVNVQPAGNYVTREVFDATLGPIQSDVSEMKADVKTLLAAHNGNRAIQSFVKTGATLLTTVAAGSIGAILALLFH